MKKQVNLISRIAVVAVIGAGLCVAVPVRAAEATPKTDAAKTDKAKTEKPTPAPLSDKDKTFMQDAAKADDGSRDGQDGPETGQKREVKKVRYPHGDDTSKANTQLQALARRRV